MPYLVAFIIGFVAFAFGFFMWVESKRVPPHSDIDYEGRMMGFWSMALGVVIVGITIYASITQLLEYFSN